MKRRSVLNFEKRKQRRELARAMIPGIWTRASPFIAALAQNFIACNEVHGVQLRLEIRGTWKRVPAAKRRTRRYRRMIRNTPVLGYYPVDPITGEQKT